MLRGVNFTMIVAAKSGRIALNAVLACFGIFLGALASTAYAHAQSAEQTAKIVADLKPEAQSVIARLSKLSQLPDGKWKMHSGDLAHGEAVKLDDSSWQGTPSDNEATNDAVWFSQTLVVPDTLSGY